jgi:predicted nucleic acid-binding Zn ribbon protein
MGASRMNQCAACGLPTFRRLCNFDQRTFELIHAKRCVSCTAPIHPGDSLRSEGKCGECMERLVRLCKSTRWLLRQAAKARVIVGARAA